MHNIFTVFHIPGDSTRYISDERIRDSRLMQNDFTLQNVQ